MINAPPLSLYIHIPWCIRKCPYCDFNSHQQKGNLPIEAYVKNLIADLQEEAQRAEGRPLTSLFFGGGTPSLFPAKAIGGIIKAAEHKLGFADNIEITLEANPGASEYHNLAGLRRAGVNRLSFGVQSFHAEQLKHLGRVHGPKEAIDAFKAARDAGFDNINIDLMHGLPQQTDTQACIDIERAIALSPEHISWYQLTIEPNTAFYSAPPILPHENILESIQQKGQTILGNAGYGQYEVSAYSKAGKQSRHNLNYWQFGDYLAIGAGAHGKVTAQDGRIWRYRKTRKPEDYMAITPPNTFIRGQAEVDKNELALEFMMNALRLNNGVPTHFFEERTGLALDSIKPIITTLRQKDLIHADAGKIATTPQGLAFLDSVLAHFNSDS